MEARVAELASTIEAAERRQQELEASILGLEHQLEDARERHALLQAELRSMHERAEAAEGRERVSAQKLLILNGQYTRMLAAGDLVIQASAAAG